MLSRTARYGSKPAVKCSVVRGSVDQMRRNLKPPAWVGRVTSGVVICSAFTWLIVSGSLARAQDVRLTSHPARADGRLVGVTILKDVPKATPQEVREAVKEIEDEDFSYGAAQQVAKATPYEGIKALTAVQGPVPVLASNTTSSPTTPSLLSFLPPQTIDETQCSGNWRAPDGALAASPSYLVEVNNSCLKVLNPSTGAVIAGPTALSKFFSSSSYTIDGRALYDPVNGRFIVSAEDASNNRVVVAASKGSNPTLGWNVYSFGMAGNCSPGTGDFPMLGQSNQEPGDPEGAIYLSWNIFCPPNGPSNFVGALSKSLVYAGAPITSINGFVGLSMEGQHVDSVQPANVMNPSDHPRGEFLVNSFDWHFGGGSCKNGCNGVVVWDFYNGVPASGSAQSITGVVVPTTNTYHLPPNAPEPGCAVNTCGPNAGPPIISGEVTYSSGSLFGAISDGMGLLIVELEPFVDDSGAITGALMRNEICFVCGGFSNGGQAYYGTIQPDSERNWVMVYNYSAPGTAGCTPDPNTCIYPSTAFLTHRVTQARNTLHDNGSILTLGQAYFSQVASGVNRFGDYNAVAPNYAAPNSYWFDGEYVESNGNWGRAVGQTAYTSPTQP